METGEGSELTLPQPMPQVEDCGDGVALAQVFDAFFPGKIPLRRLDFAARMPAEKLKNLGTTSSSPVPLAYRPLSLSLVRRAMRILCFSPKGLERHLGLLCLFHPLSSPLRQTAPPEEATCPL